MKLISVAAAALQLGVLLLATTPSADAFDYFLSEVGEISARDFNTGIDGVATLFNGEIVNITVSGLAWAERPENNASSTLEWTTLVGDTVMASGTVNLEEYNKELPTSLSVGSVSVQNSGEHTISVILGNAEPEYDQESSRTYMSYASGVAIIPLIVVLVLAMFTQMVEFSLFFTVFVGACMVRK